MASNTDRLKDPGNQVDDHITIFAPFLIFQSSASISWIEMDRSSQAQHNPSDLRVYGEESTPRSTGISQASVLIILPF